MKIYPMFIFVAFAWGFHLLWIKQSVLSFKPEFINFVHTFLGSCVCFSFIFLLKQKFKIELKDFFNFLPVSLLGFTLPFLIEILFIRDYGASFISIIITSVPIFTTLIFILLKRKVTLFDKLASIFAFFCIIGIYGEKILIENVKWNWIIPFTILIPISFAISNIYVKEKLSHFPSLLVTAWALGMTSVSFLFFIITQFSTNTNYQIFVNKIEIKSIITMLLSGVLAIGIGMIFFYHIIFKKGPLYASMLSYLAPSISIILVVFFQGETMQITQWSCFIFLIIIIISQTFYHHKKNYN